MQYLEEEIHEIVVEAVTISFDEDRLSEKEILEEIYKKMKSLETLCHAEIYLYTNIMNHLEDLIINWKDRSLRSRVQSKLGKEMLTE